MATEYYLKDAVTGNEIILCDYSDAECIAALQAEGFYMLSPENYGDKYDYPAIYTPPGIVWDQSEENKTNGDWTMMSREIDSGDGNPNDGGDQNHGGDDHGDGDHNNGDGSADNPVAVIYNDGRRNNTGMGVYYLRGSHEIGLAPYGTELNATPSKFIPLWMSDGMDIYNDLPSFPRPGGATEGITTGVVEYKNKTHVVFENKKGKFKKISF